MAIALASRAEAQFAAPSPIHKSINAEFERSGTGTIKAWVLFRDKGFATAAESRAALVRARDALDPSTKARRAVRGKQTAAIDSADLPVNSAYINQIRKVGINVHVVSDWVNGVSVTASRAQLEHIAALPFVEKIQPVLRRVRKTPVVDQGNHVAPRGATDVGAPFYGLTLEQLEQISLPQLHAQGWTGSGVRVGVLDTGFDRRHLAFNFDSHRLKVIAEHDFVSGDSNTAPQTGDAATQHQHGTWVLGTIAAYKPGELVGAAFDADYILCKTEDVTNEYPAEEDFFVAGLQFVEAQGADVVTSSIGYLDWYTKPDFNGMTAVTSIAINIATSHGVHCINAAGNFGHDNNPQSAHLFAPADAFKVITVGAVDAGGTIAGFSSDGPTFDQRVKPELLARGVQTWTVSVDNLQQPQPFSGTSASAPLVAGLVACMVQAHPDWTVDQMRWYLLHTAGDFSQTLRADPLFVRGYGVADGIAASRADCNGNGTSDEQDIATGVSGDCNVSLIPDECELALNPELDEDKDGVLDACDFEGVPAVSTWGMVCTGLLLLVAGTSISSARTSKDCDFCRPSGT